MTTIEIDRFNLQKALQPDLYLYPETFFYLYAATRTGLSTRSIASIGCERFMARLLQA